MTISTDALHLDADTQRLLFVDARSPLAFSDAPVEVDVIRAAYDLVKWGPTSGNSMPMRIAIADSDDARGVVLGAASGGNRVKVDTAPMVIVVAADNNYHRLSHITSPSVAGLEEKLEAAPERRVATAASSTWIQLGYFIIGLRAAGLAVRPMSGFDMAAITDRLFADSGWSAQAVLTVGYPAGEGEDGTPPRAGRPEWDDAAKVF